MRLRLISRIAALCALAAVAFAIVVACWFRPGIMRPRW